MNTEMQVMDPVEHANAVEISVPEKVAKQFGKVDILAKAESFRPFTALKIAGVADKETYRKVKDASRELMKLRTSTEAKKAFLKRDALEYGRAVDSDYKEITEKIIAIESQLDQEIARIDAIEKAEKEAKQKAINERVAQRTQELSSYRHNLTGIAHLLAGMPDDQYAIVRDGAKAKFEAEEKLKAEQAAELARLQAEEAERKRKEEEAKAESQRAEAERLEAQRKAQAEAQAKIDAQLAEIARKEKAMADAKAKQEADEAARVAEESRKAREAEIAAKAAEKAREDAIAQAKAEAERKEREAKAEEARKAQEAKDAEAKRIADEKAKAEKLAAIEAAKPDVEKLRDFADFVRKISLPALTTEKGENVIRLLRVSLDNLKDLVNSEADKLTK